jgi:ABC-type multidrug transport system fused ATPase/permease subunit
VRFATTIRKNKVLGRHDAMDAEVVEVSRVANTHHFIAGLPEGYET